MLPFVPLLDAHADTEAPPRRLVFFFNSNGTIRDNWLPTSDDSGLLLSPILSPLEKLKSKLIVVDGLCHRVVLEKGDRSGHSAGMNTVLTGRKVKSIDPEHQPLRSLATGISIDQYIAQRIGARTKLSTLECGIVVEPYTSDNAALSYLGELRPILPESSPYVVFDRLFANFAIPTATVNPDAAVRAADRTSVLSLVSKDAERMRSRLPQSDRIKMEAHLDAVRAVEHSLTTGVGEAAHSCVKPELGAPIDIWRNANIPTLAKLQMDLMVMALSCDLTRVGTIQFGRAGAAHRFSWLGHEFNTDPTLVATDEAKGFHALAHKEADPAARAKLIRIHTWYAGQLAYFLGRLASIPEAGGSMLDNTIVVWINELGSGSTHSHELTPWVIAGNAGGFFKTGQLVSFPREPHNRLLLTLCHAMGVEDEAFGDPDYCKAGPLTGVRA